ncbi:MAG: glycosyltransferase [Candidatus Competibacteraceae bacterium]|nr:glycosyltransferase [Candidatus Competibacteraceae bacterium]
MSIPKVSVCVVTYNHARYIRNCLMSVLAQCEDISLEILVGDDLSEDETGEILQLLAYKYSSLIRYFRHAERKGPSVNYQFLIREACGKYIAHLDGDDFWLPGKLAAQVRFMEQHPDCPAVYSNAIAIRDDGVLLGVFNNFQPTRFDINSLLRRGNFLNHSSMLYRAFLRENLLALPPPFLDYRIHLRHARHGAIGYLNQALVGYRVNSSSSIIVHANDNVRRLYWEALLDAPRDSVNANDLASGIAEFARSIFFRSIRKKDISLLRQWLPIIVANSPVSRVKMSVLIFAAIIRVGIRESLAALYAHLSGNSLRAIYYRQSDSSTGNP